MNVTRGGDGRWRTIRYALKNWGRTFRLIAIALALAAPSVGITLMLIYRRLWYPCSAIDPPG